MAVEVVSVSTGLGSELGSGGLVEGEGIGVWEGGGGGGDLRLKLGVGTIGNLQGGGI